MNLVPNARLRWPASFAINGGMLVGTDTLNITPKSMYIKYTRFLIFDLSPDLNTFRFGFWG
jgi:hypothetical protein